MKKVKLIIILLFVLPAIIFLGYLGKTRVLPKKLTPQVYSRESSTAGVVEIEVIPKELKPGGEMIFTLNLNNHSIDLDYDYARIAIVVDNNGNIYKPIKWTGGSGGHHVSGDLVFDKLSSKVTNIGLNLIGIDNQKVMFEWKL